MKSPTILVVDDDPLTRKVVRATLKSGGYAVLEAEDAHSALDVLSHDSPDLILQDLVLPDVDGIDLIKQIRAIPAASQIPTLAFSAFPLKLEQARQLHVGFTGYILKPIEPSRLLATIRGYTTPEHETPNEPGRGRHILVVDDDPLQRKLLRIRLEQLGFVVSTAVDGEDALDSLRRSPAAAIVSDVLMPRLDGFKFSLAVRQDPLLAHIPVVLTSAVFVEEADLRLAASVGANAFVLRTPDLQEVIGALASLDDVAEPQTRRSIALPTSEYAARISNQLSHQATVSAELSQRIEWLEAKLAILGGLAETTKRNVPADAVVDDILHRALDSSGAGKGAAYLIDTEGRVTLRARLGYEDGHPTDLSGFLGGTDLLKAALEGREPIEVASLADWSTEGLPASPGASSMLIVPLTYGEELLGLLALEWEGDDGVRDRHFITTTVARQVGQAIALVRALANQQRLYQQVQDLNQDLQRQTLELQTANKELEAFSYSISHDLRAPLRAISGFARMLVEDNAALLPPKAQDHLRTVGDNAEQMGRLIDGLLSFARLSRQAVNKVPVNSGLLVREVLDSLRSESDGREVEIQVGELPQALADPTLLRQVFFNLLSNALKFTRIREVASIEVGCLQHEAETIFFVKDNGAGFDAAYAHRLFGVFQRLHSDEEFEGTGVGLAIAQRIVQRHGGRVWAEGTPNAGATFYFSLGRLVTE